jgi:hypothetical protein
MRILFISPPPLKPSEPGLSAPAAAQALCHLGADAVSVDAAIGWHTFALAPARLEKTLAAIAASGELARTVPKFRRAIAALRASPPALRRSATYANRSVYSSAVAHLESALALVAAPYAGLRLGVASVSGTTANARSESSAWLSRFAAAPGPYDAYFMDDLIPLLRREHPTHVGISLTFQEQAAAGCRLARLLACELPTVVRLVGGPLIACLAAVGHALDKPPFDIFHRVLPGTDLELEALARELGAAPRATPRPRPPLSVDLDRTAWETYLTPEPVVPAAFGRGCYWRRCTFCPEALHPVHRACDTTSLQPWLRRVADRFPDGAMLHLTDSALPMTHLEEIACVISRDRLPLKWHGFVRIEPELAVAGFADLLAAGGCAMLQLGVESGSPRLLQRMGKGTLPELSRRVLRATAKAGIRNQVYLLFGLPTENDTDRELTLELVEEEAAAIHALNPALLNLPRGAPMHRSPASFGITELRPFDAETDLSLYDDFRCGSSHPRLEARRWLDRRFFKNERVRAIGGHLRVPLKANHLCFL